MGGIAGTCKTFFFGADEIDAVCGLFKHDGPGRCLQSYGGWGLRILAYDQFPVSLARLVRAAVTATGAADDTFGVHHFVVNNMNSHEPGQHWVTMTVELTRNDQQTGGLHQQTGGLGAGQVQLAVPQPQPAPAAPTTRTVSASASSGSSGLADMEVDDPPRGDCDATCPTSAALAVAGTLVVFVRLTALRSVVLLWMARRALAVLAVGGLFIVRRANRKR